jgi:hypothetical protein
MSVVRKAFIYLFAILLIVGCKQNKKPVLSGEEPVAVSDFIEFFQQVELPYQLSDTIFERKEKDSSLISNKVFTQFVPDSIVRTLYGKGVKPKIYALGRVDVSKAETYIFVKTISADKKVLLILCFDKNQKFITALPVLQFDNNKATQQSVSMDRNYSITQKVLLKNADASINEGKDVFSLNADAKKFMLIMTDALTDKITELLNPIDTLSRKNKLSADYTNGSMNLVSIRDGRKSDRISFFIHFEKNNGECTGELKGEAMLKSPNTAEYRENGDPCVLKFIFTSTSVALKEEEGCGARRGLNCAFDGNYTRKKYVKPTGTDKPPANKK